MSRYTGGGGFLTLDWWLTNASLDFDFRNSRYYDSSLGTPTSAVITNYLSITRASSAFAKTSTGTWTSFGTNTLRITDLGLTCEDARTNLFLNSQAPATQTITVVNATQYTVSVYGTASVVLSGAGTGTATQGNDVTFTSSTTSLTCTVSGAGGAFQNVNVEAGAWSTSPIVTTGTSATRAADNITMIGTLQTLIASMPLSLVADVTTYVTPTDFWAIVASVSTVKGLLGTSNFPSIMLVNDGVTNQIHDFSSSGRTWTGGVKVACGNASGARSICGGGVSPTTDAFGSSISDSVLGGVSAGFSHLYGYIRRLTAWNSKLADATLQALTT